MFIDSHCHPYMLNLSHYDNSFDRFMCDTHAAGVDQLLFVSVDMETAKQCIALSSHYENACCSVGAHPGEKEEVLSFEMLCELAEHPKVVAIGETGLDYYYHSDQLDIMQNRFRTHIQAAIKMKKPLIIHTRNAREDTLKIMQEEKAHIIGGVMHCFTESIDMAKASLDLNFYISFSGIITFKNAKELLEVVRYVPLDKILIETDAPYLAPVPFRGKQNEPKYVKYVAEKIAEIKNISVEAVAHQTSENFRSLFFSY